jgi:hypothetical protein
MKRALVGFVTNITANYSKIKIRTNSFKKHCKNDAIYLIAANASNEEIDLLIKLDINIHNIIIDDNDLQFINHKRLYYTYDLLSKIDIEYILVTDVFDVIFQNDPFKKLDFNKFDLFLTLEGVLVSEEPWNSDVINKIFPEYYQLCRNRDVICSGIIAGKRDHLINLLSSMYNLCENCSNNHNIKDQAALIVLDTIKRIDAHIKYLSLKDGWVVNCAVAGPTNFFESWGFKNTIEKRYLDIPVLRNNNIYIGDLQYDIVHQFNRISEWNKELIKDYE